MADANVRPKEKPKDEEKKEYTFDFDELKLYFSEPYIIKTPNDKYIEITQPSIGDILLIGDREVYSSIFPFVTNTTACRVQLWDMGIDWNKITDYELFSKLISSIKNVEFLFRLVLPLSPGTLESNDIKSIDKTYEDIDFSNFKAYGIKDDSCEGETSKEIFLYNPEQDILINEETYMHIREYIRMMFNYYPKEEFAKGKLAKKWIIADEKDRIERESKNNRRKNKSILLPLVSSLLNHPGFKYDLDGIKKLGIFAFMDSVQRLKVYEQCTAFMGGMYSGFMDTSKLGPEELNKRVDWLQDIYVLDK